MPVSLKMLARYMVRNLVPNKLLMFTEKHNPLIILEWTHTERMRTYLNRDPMSKVICWWTQ